MAQAGVRNASSAVLSVTFGDGAYFRRLGVCEVVSQFALLWPAMQWEAHVVLARVCLRGL